MDRIFFGFALLALWVVAPLPAFGEKMYFPMDALALAEQRSAEVQCQQQLAAILRAARAWSTDNSDLPPPGLLMLTNDVEKPAAFFCPAIYHSVIPTNWSEVDWDHLDYTWNAPVDWDDTTNVVCVCRAHNLAALVDGTVVGQGCRFGWPLLTASPMQVYATPGEEARLAVRLAPDVRLPVFAQWRASALVYVTNITRVSDPDDPTRMHWVTNVLPSFVGTNLPAQTNLFLQLPDLQTNSLEWYSVVLSNEFGAGLSHQARVNVHQLHAGISTNSRAFDAVCRNNLYQIYLFARLMDAAGIGVWPESLQQMTNRWAEPIFGWPLALYCRADTNHVAPADWPAVNFDETSYEIVPGDRLVGFEIFCRCRVHGYYFSVDGTAMLGPLFTGIMFQPGGTVDLQFRTFAGKENVLESTGDWIEWKPLATYGPTAAEVHFTDAATEAMRFYRLRLQ